MNCSPAAKSPSSSAMRSRHAHGAPSEGRAAIPVWPAPVLARALLDGGRAAPFRGDRQSSGRRAQQPHGLSQPARKRAAARGGTAASLTWAGGSATIGDQSCVALGRGAPHLRGAAARSSAWEGALAQSYPSRGPGRRRPPRAKGRCAGGARYDVEYRVVRPDGTVRVVHSQGDVTRDESGRIVRQFGVHAGHHGAAAGRGRSA